MKKTEYKRKFDKGFDEGFLAGYIFRTRIERGEAIPEEAIPDLRHKLAYWFPYEINADMCQRLFDIVKEVKQSQIISKKEENPTQEVTP